METKQSGERTPEQGKPNNEQMLALLQEYSSAIEADKRNDADDDSIKQSSIAVTRKAEFKRLYAMLSKTEQAKLDAFLKEHHEADELMFIKRDEDWEIK